MDETDGSIIRRSRLLGIDSRQARPLGREMGLPSGISGFGKDRTGPRTVSDFKPRKIFPVGSPTLNCLASFILLLSSKNRSTN